MEQQLPASHHPHFARRVTAFASAVGATIVWLMIYSALWQARVVTHWMHHLILLVGTLGAFSLPCLAVWFVCRCMDRARDFRGF